MSEDDVDRGCNCHHPTHHGRCGKPTSTGRGRCEDCKRGNHNHVTATFSLITKEALPGPVQDSPLSLYPS